jgi:hypothetical protein
MKCMPFHNYGSLGGTTGGGSGVVVSAIAGTAP